MIQALKATVAYFSGDPEWERVRPPLVELDATQTRALREGIERTGFGMDLPRAAAA